MDLKFGKANAKLKALEQLTGKKVYTFSLLSGHNCPYAKDCHSKVEVKNNKRKVVDGPHTQFRCFSASEEAVYTGVYNVRKHNTDLIAKAGPNKSAELIKSSIPSGAEIIRIHVGGDFKTQWYFDAWLKVAQDRPDILFYFYTKSLPFLVKRLDDVNALDNFVYTASRGGFKDELIDEYGLREAIVVYHPDEAEYEIDHDDSHAALGNTNFNLLIHGTQPKDSLASEAIKKLKKEKVKYSYG